MIDRSRRGFTLIEILVAIMVLGMLVAVLLPAVQAAREASRRAMCANNLKQIGLALATYESACGCFPGAINGTRYYSFLVMLLPHLDQQPLYNAFNFDGPWLTVADPDPDWTVRRISVSAFLCPSDSTASETSLPLTNYAGNTGFVPERGHAEGCITSPEVGPAGIADGMSRTVAVSEWTLGRPPLETNSTYHLPGQTERFAAACRALDQRTAKRSSRGVEWHHGSPGITLYNHLVVPNGNSCRNGPDDHRPYYYAWTSGSAHPGGAHAVFADGHVQFVKDGIALATWRALGSRAGGEAVSDADF